MTFQNSLLAKETMQEQFDKFSRKDGGGKNMNNKKVPLNFIQNINRM